MKLFKKQLKLIFIFIFMAKFKIKMAKISQTVPDTQGKIL